jgi:hypothetical protein
MDVNKLLTPAMVRLLNDSTLKTLLGASTIPAVKGARRPKTMMGTKCFTVHVLSNPRDEDSKVHNGTMLINFYCPNYSEGNAAIETMGPVVSRVVELFDDKPLAMDGYNNFNLTVQEPLGPLFDPLFPDEHSMSIRIKFNLIKKGSV